MQTKTFFLPEHTDRRTLTNIIVPEGYTEIGKDAFRDCPELVNVFLPDSLTRIAEGAFRKCPSLKHMILPSGLSEVARGAFDKTLLTVETDKDTYQKNSTNLPKGTKLENPS